MRKTVKEAFSNAIETYRSKEFLVASSDMLVQYNDGAKSLRFFDDSEELIVETTLTQCEQWIEEAKEYLRTPEFASLLNSVEILKPFSVILVDDDFVATEELVTISDGTIYLDEQFLKEYNNDLDTFFDKLMEE